jgi:metal-responsive CopG/Arc/MetJ family transcriptional regulator
MEHMKEDFISSITAGVKGKKKASYSIDATLLNKFDVVCTVKKYNKSKIIENMIKVFIEQENSLFSPSNQQN